MSSKRKSFVESYLAGEATLDDFEQYEVDWHAGRSAKSLANYLGFSEDEYSSFVENPSTLHSLLEMKRPKVALAAVRGAKPSGSGTAHQSGAFATRLGKMSAAEGLGHRRRARRTGS
jgi:hypothetical protein